jgi:hypothetical protein
MVSDFVLDATKFRKLEFCGAGKVGRFSTDPIRVGSLIEKTAVTLEVFTHANPITWPLLVACIFGAKGV